MQRRRFSAAGLVLVGALGCGPSAGDPPIPLPADMTALDGRAAEAIRAAHEALTAERSNAELWARLGMTYEGNDLPQLALACYDRAIALAESAKLWYRHAIVQSKEGDGEAAVRSMRRSIELEGEYAPCYWRLGSFLFDMGAIDEAEAAYRRATELDPNHLGGWTGLARVHLQRDENAEAIGILERALRSNRDQPYVLKLLKAAYVQAGRLEDANRITVAWSARKALGRDPWNAEYRPYEERPVMEQARAHLRTGQPAKAAAMLEAFLEEGSDDLNAYAYLAWAYFQMGRLDQAEKTAEGALERDADNVPVLRVLASIQRGSGRSQAALATFDRILAADPRNVDALKSKGKLLRQLGRNAEAVEVLERVLLLDQSDPEVATELEAARTALGEEEQ